MDITLFIFFTLFGFLCLFLSRDARNSGLGFGLGIIATMVFILIGLLIGGDQEPITTTLVINNSAEIVPIMLGISNDNVAILYFALAILSIFIGVD